MAVVNHDKRVVGFKIVYCGTPLGGKTTNLIYIHEQLTPSVRGDLVSIATAKNRTLFFDFLPVHATEIAGYQTKFQLYTVPGQKVYDETRQVVLTGVDGIVFVADSDPARMEANLEALAATRHAIEALGSSLDRIPTVFQYNKRDLSGAVTPEIMDELLGVRNSAYLACANSGYNVFRTLDAVTQAVLRDFHSGLAESKSRGKMAASRNAPPRNPAAAGRPAEGDRPETALAS